MKKEEMKVSSPRTNDNSFGVASVVIGIVAIVFASLSGIVLGLVGLYFAMKQKSVNPNRWSRNGMILNIIALVVSLIVIGISVWYIQNASLFGAA